MTQVGIYGELQPESLGNPPDCALRNFPCAQALFLQHPSSRPNTDTVQLFVFCNVQTNVQKYYPEISDKQRTL